MKRVSTGLLLALCTLAFAVAGCGGSRGGNSDEQLSKAAYKAKLTEISKQVDSAHAALSRGARSATTVAGVQAALHRYAAAEQRIGDEVSELNVPANAKKANAELARGWHDDSAEIQALIPKLVKFKSLRETFSFLQSLGHTKGGDEQSAALQKLQQLGYTSTS